MPLCDGHIVGRLALFPKYLESQTGLFDIEQLFEFAKLKDKEGNAIKASGWSIASEIMAKGDQGVHGYGGRSAETQNAGYVERHGRRPDPESVYLGYFRFDAATLNSFRFECHTMYIRWKPEHEEVCHFQLEITPVAGSQRVLRKAERRLLVRTVCQAVTAFVQCDYDSEGDEHGSLIEELVAGFEDQFGILT